MAKFNVSTYSQLERVLQQAVQEAMTKVVLEVQRMMKDYVKEHLYNAYSPFEYIRSYEYLESLTVTDVRKSVSGELETKVFFDPKKIHSVEVKDSYWNRHMSVNGDTMWKDKPISEWIPIFMEYGTKNSKWDREGIKVVDNIMKKLDNDGKYKKFMVNELKRMGLDVI